MARTTGSEDMTPSRPIRLLICDDSVFMRMAIRTVCDAHPDIEIIGEAEDGEDAIRAVKELSPDIVTMDISMPGLDGVAATTEIAQTHDVPIIILSSLTERRSALAERLMEVGAVDVIWKSASLMDIDIDGIANTILEKILFWGRHHAPATDDNDIRAKPSEDELKALQSRIDSSDSSHTFLLISMGAGSQDSVTALFGQLGNHCPPIIIQPNVPQSCLDGFIRYLRKRASVPVMIAQDGQNLENGHIYCAFASAGLALESLEEGTFSFCISKGVRSPDLQLSWLHQTLVAIGARPLTIVLSGASVETCSNILNTSQNNAVIVETPATCPQAQAAAHISHKFSHSIECPAGTIGALMRTL
ncbi:response regulator [Thalassospira alkalitolerans]|uniref:response regulator n=1 Tax=Thalassospira alkalitolerans TaxID=1293890 RepID=UPI00111C4E86|nr:response regulator [Thalassospira alkalitolerans]